jgi:hypothetical protein
MNTGGVEITGIEETMEMLKSAPRTVVASGFVRALSAAANVMADEIERRCPEKTEDVGGILDKGELRDSIVVAVELDSQLRGGVGYAGFSTSNGADFVAQLLEYGHRLIGHKPGKKPLGFVAPTPFIRPAFEFSAEAAVDAFSDSLRTTVTQTFPQTNVA